MEYKYPIETHNSVGFKNTSDFNNEAFNDYLHHDMQSGNRSGYLTCSYDELKNLLGNPIKLSASLMYPETVKEIVIKTGKIISFKFIWIPFYLINEI